jgi:hypothetical protein
VRRKRVEVEQVELTDEQATLLLSAVGMGLGLPAGGNPNHPAIRPKIAASREAAS